MKILYVKECQTHGRTEFKLSRRSKQEKNRKVFDCIKCINKRNEQRREAVKLFCINYKGDKCIRCGYSKHIRCLDFHHLSDYKKEFGIARYSNRSLDKNNFKATLEKELDKCELLCKNCHQEEHTKNSPLNDGRIKKRYALFESLGGQCFLCKNSNLKQLTFHHLDPDIKEFNLSTNIMSFAILKDIWKEIQSCIILCANCHGETEGKEHLKEMEFLKETAPHLLLKYEEVEMKFLPQIKEPIKNNCIDCDNVIDRKAKRCLECHHLTIRKVSERPSYAELTKIIEETNVEEVGRKYNVSGNAIRKWIRAYEKELSSQNN